MLCLTRFRTSLEAAYDDRYVVYLRATPLKEENPFFFYEPMYDSLRDSARVDEERVSTNSLGKITTSVIFNLRNLLRESAMFSILMTFFVAIMLIGGSIVFTNDAERLVIQPIERMMNMVDAVAQDPLAPLHFDQNMAGAGQYETRLLESTIEKITGLLRVGFGEAGAGIISANLQKDSAAAVNPLLPGVRIYAIFGFCDIHHFEDINQKLSNDVLVFVNRVAEIVHNSVHTWSGQCNKNLGNAFVVVWRIGDEETLMQMNAGPAGKLRSLSQESMGSMKGSFKGASRAESMDDEDGQGQQRTRKAATVDLRRVPGVDILADHALIGYTKIIAEINRNKNVLKYRQEPRLTNKGKDVFKVRMGFGLHAGWAIEGAVGSIQKVDATYLSPHVNMAARLETSSKQYGVPLLASQDFFDLMSNEAQSLMRRLDVITVKGSEVPIGIYTYDALQDQTFLEDKQRRKNGSKNEGSVTLMGLSTPSNDMGSCKQGEGVSPNTSPSKASHKKGAAGGGNSTPGPPAGTPEAPSQGKGASANTPDGDVPRRPSMSLIPGEGKPALWLTPADNTGDIFDNDYDMLTLRKHIEPEFLDAHKDGISLYVAGDWPASRAMLEKADRMMAERAPALGGDGPSQTVLRYMASFNFEAPKSWKGFRPLTSK